MVPIGDPLQRVHIVCGVRATDNVLSVVGGYCEDRRAAHSVHTHDARRRTMKARQYPDIDARARLNVALDESIHLLVAMTDFTTPAA